jgi:hypothetical protein
LALNLKLYARYRCLHWWLFVVWVVYSCCVMENVTMAVYSIPTRSFDDMYGISSFSAHDVIWLEINPFTLSVPLLWKQTCEAEPLSLHLQILPQISSTTSA